MKLQKYHGCGNDFVLIHPLAIMAVLDPPGGSVELEELVRQVCNRHTGIGADGLIVVDRSAEGAVLMRIFNSDGSTAEMCGNGIRCVADYALRRWSLGPEFTIRTDSGPKQIEVVSGGYKVNMGSPVFDPDKIPMKSGGIDEFGVPWFALSRIRGLEVLDTVLYGVSMGNPHAVRFEEGSYYFRPNVESLGPQIEQHPDFPNKINVEFAHVVNEHHAKVDVWERGAGATLACGTGACAVAATGIRRGLLTSPVEVELPGGKLIVEWDGKGDIYMTGPAVKVADIEYHYGGEA